MRPLASASSKKFNITAPNLLSRSFIHTATTTPRSLAVLPSRSLSTTITPTVTLTPTPPLITHPPISGKNALAETLTSPYTPGQALFVLQRKGAHGSLISKADFTDLCDAARPGKLRDARVIYNALKDFRRCWSFELRDPALATKAVEGMMRGFTPELGDDSDDGNKARYEAVNQFKAALYAASAFADRRTGLYYATEVTTLNGVLRTLLAGLEGLAATEQPLPEEDATATPLTVDRRKADPARLAALYLVAPAPHVLRRRLRKRARYVLRRLFGNQSLPWTKSFADEPTKVPTADLVRRVVRETFYTLLIRAAKPEEHMKKKMRRHYLFQLLQDCDQGPDADTVMLVVRLCGLLGGESDDVREIVELWTKTNQEGDHSELMKLVEEMEADNAEEEEIEADSTEDEGTEETVAKDDAGDNKQN